MNDERLTKLEKDIAAIQERNRRVEAGKAWETSAFRIPTIGYFLSAQSLPPIRRWWTGKHSR